MSKLKYLDICGVEGCDYEFEGCGLGRMKINTLENIDNNHPLLERCAAANNFRALEKEDWWQEFLGCE